MRSRVALVSGEELLADVRRLVDSSVGVVLDELVLSSSTLSEARTSVRVEFTLHERPSRVEVVRVSTAFATVVTVPTAGAHVGGDYLYDGFGDLPWPEDPRPVPSNEDYRRLLDLAHRAPELPLPHLDAHGTTVYSALHVARSLEEATPATLAAATTLLTDLVDGVPLEWALRRADGAGA